MATNNGFTDQAQEALRLAHEIVQQKQHSQLDVEHILLALLKPRDGLVCQIIEKLGGDPRLLSRRVDDVLNASPRLYSGYGGMTQNIHISMRAQRMISEAANEAQALEDEFIGVEHILLAIASERGGSADSLLGEMNINKARISEMLGMIRNKPRATDRGNIGSPYYLLLTRVARLQQEIAALRHELEVLLIQEQDKEQKQEPEQEQPS